MRLACVMACLAAVVVVGPAGASELRDTNAGFTLSPPEFALPAVGATAARVIVLGPTENGFAPNMNVTVQEIKTTRDEYIEKSNAQFAAKGLKVHSSSKRDVSGEPAVVFDYEGDMGGRSLRFLSLAIVRRDRIVLVTYTAPPSSFPALETEFQRSLSSFRLADAEPGTRATH